MEARINPFFYLPEESRSVIDSTSKRRALKLYRLEQGENGLICIGDFVDISLPKTTTGVIHSIHYVQDRYSIIALHDGNIVLLDNQSDQSIFYSRSNDTEYGSFGSIATSSRCDGQFLYFATLKPSDHRQIIYVYKLQISFADENPVLKPKNIIQLPLEAFTVKTLAITVDNQWLIIGGSQGLLCRLSLSNNNYQIDVSKKNLMSFLVPKGFSSETVIAFCSDQRTGKSSRAFALTTSNKLLTIFENQVTSITQLKETEKYTCLASSQNGTLFVGGGGGLVRIFHADSGALLDTLPPPHPVFLNADTLQHGDSKKITYPRYHDERLLYSDVTSMQLLHSGTNEDTIAVSFHDKSLYIWDVHRENGSIKKLFSRIGAPGQLLGVLSNSPGNEMLVWSDDGTIRFLQLTSTDDKMQNIYDYRYKRIFYLDPNLYLRQQGFTRPLEKREQYARTVVASHKLGVLLVGDRSGHLKILNYSTGSELAGESLHTGDITALDCLELPDSGAASMILATGGRDKRLVVSELRHEKNVWLIQKLQTIREHVFPIVQARFAYTLMPESSTSKLRLISAGTHGNLFFRYLKDDITFATHVNHQLGDQICSLQVDCTQRFVAVGTSRGHVFVYTTDGKLVRQYQFNDGKFITASDSANSSDNRHHAKYFTCLTFDPSGIHLAIALSPQQETPGFRAIYIINIFTGNNVSWPGWEKQIHSSTITGLSWSGDGQFISCVTISGGIFTFSMAHEDVLAEISERLRILKSNGFIDLETMKPLDEEATGDEQLPPNSTAPRKKRPKGKWSTKSESSGGGGQIPLFCSPEWLAELNEVMLSPPELRAPGDVAWVPKKGWRFYHFQNQENQKGSSSPPVETESQDCASDDQQGSHTWRPRSLKVPIVKPNSIAFEVSLDNNDTNNLEQKAVMPDSPIKTHETINVEHLVEATAVDKDIPTSETAFEIAPIVISPIEEDYLIITNSNEEVHPHVEFVDETGRLKAFAEQLSRIRANHYRSFQQEKEMILHRLRDLGISPTATSHREVFLPHSPELTAPNEPARALRRSQSLHNVLQSIPPRETQYDGDQGLTTMQKDMEQVDEGIRQLVHRAVTASHSTTKPQIQKYLQTLALQLQEYCATLSDK